jgi:hypothetical protein
LVSSSNQLQFLPGATGHSTTITTTNPASNVTITLPDPGASTDTFALIGKTQTFTGANTFNNASFPNGIPGNLNTPTSGQIGEFISSSISSYNYTVTTTPVQVLSITLSAGNWTISAMGVFINTGGSQTAQYMCISTTSASFSGVTAGDNYALGSCTTTSLTMSIPNYHVALTSSTTLYLNCQVNFSSGVEEIYARISAIRTC